jgi:hypothetical protein
MITRKEWSKWDRAVYFIQAGKSGPVKIGSSRLVFDRMASIQAHHYEELTLRAVFPIQCLPEETMLHHELDKFRLRGEWYVPRGKVRELMKLHACEPVSALQRGIGKLARNSAKKKGNQNWLARYHEREPGRTAGSLTASPPVTSRSVR